MDCPVCKTTALVMSERQGIEIDYCPQCRGVWLDRGELDKLIERAVPAQAPQQAAPPPPPPARYDDRDQGRAPQGYRDSHNGHRDHHQQGHYPRKKKESFLSDLFDF
jgi:Zn-finger nucleic acid-binding protein